MPINEDIELGVPLLSPESNNEEIETTFTNELGNQPLEELPDTSRNLMKRVIKQFRSRQTTSSDTSEGPVESPADEPEALQRWFRRKQKLNTELLNAIEDDDIEKVKSLLKNQGTPNATCRLSLASACHIAALRAAEILSILLENQVKKIRIDKLGRTPLHLAAYAGNERVVAMLLGIPEDMINEIRFDDTATEIQEDVKKLMDSKCYASEINRELRKYWRDDIDHKCKELDIPPFEPGWTALHVASAYAQKNCVRILLYAGADPNIEDEAGRTVLDVAGCTYNKDHEMRETDFVEVIQMLLTIRGTFKTMNSNLNLDNIETPLHTAVDISSIPAIEELLRVGASLSCHNKDGETPLHMCVRKKRENLLRMLIKNCSGSIIVDVKDSKGRTLLQLAVETDWYPGVAIALQADADVTCEDNNGNCPLLTAAARGNITILKEIVNIAKKKDVLDYINSKRHTAFLLAVLKGHIDCVKLLIREGANIEIIMKGGFTILHTAVSLEYVEILEMLLKHDENITRRLINVLGQNLKFKISSALHIAVSLNNVECVKLLLSKGADVKSKCQSYLMTPLHMAALANSIEIANIIIQFDKSAMNVMDSMGHSPLHIACIYDSRDVIKLLLKEGADLSQYVGVTSEQTAIGLIFDNLSDPKEFMEDIFDSYIYSNGEKFRDLKCKVTVDYRILMPNVDDKDKMKVIKALLETGNRYDQENLLIHPLIESFLYWKWKTLFSNHHFIMFSIHFIYLVSFMLTMGCFFYFKDSGGSHPKWLNYQFCAFVVGIFWVYKVYMDCKLNIHKKWLAFETWINLSAKALSFVLIFSPDSEFGRHVATIALLLSSLDTLFLASMFPKCGYYVLMFKKVAKNVIKILFMFIFMVIGFSLCFMLQFRSAAPFNGPGAALVKTIVMLTSEFDYTSMIDDKQTLISIIIIRIVFVCFLVLNGIVLMNLLTGMAVNDINKLEEHGRIKRLKRRAEFLSNMNVQQKPSRILPSFISRIIQCDRYAYSVAVIYPGRPSIESAIFKHLSVRIKENIFKKVRKQQKVSDKEGESLLKNNIKEIPKSKNEQDAPERTFNECLETKAYIEDTKIAIMEKIDQIFTELQTVMENLAILSEITRESYA